MLKVKNQKVLHDESLKSLNEELFLQETLTLLLGEEISLKASDNNEKENEVNFSSFYLLKGADNFRIGFDFSNLYSFKDNLQNYLRLITFASTLSKLQSEKGKFKGFYFADPEEHSDGLAFRKYEIQSASGLIGILKVAVPSNCSLFFDGQKPALQRTDEMQESSETVNLGIGNVQIDLSHFLDLREGMEIECDMPECFTASLDLGNQKYATVRAQVENHKLKLKIINFENLVEA